MMAANTVCAQASRVWAGREHQRHDQRHPITVTATASTTDAERLARGMRDHLRVGTAAITAPMSTTIASSVPEIPIDLSGTASATRPRMGKAIDHAGSACQRLLGVSTATGK